MSNSNICLKLYLPIACKINPYHTNMKDFHYKTSCHTTPLRG